MKLRIQLRIYFVLTYILISSFSSRGIYAWGEHYLMTSRAIDIPELSFLDKKVKAHSLNSFVLKNKHELGQFFKDYYRYMEDEMDKDIPDSFLHHPFSSLRIDNASDKNEAALSEFLSAARMQPRTKFPMVTRILPGQKIWQKIITAKEVSPYLPVSEKFYTEFIDSAGKEVSLKSVLATFSDEPDWHMDHDLWDLKKYQLGEIPYGKPQGITSKAPFHMNFQNESSIVKMFIPKIKKSYLSDRVELFSRLAQFAINNGDEYWAYRFTAWTIHYLQDLTQPYHSRLVPNGDLAYYTKYIFTWDKTQFEKRAAQLLGNRHFAYEGFMASVLSMSYSKPDSINLNLVSALKKGRLYRKIKDANALAKQIMIWSAKTSTELDTIIEKQWGFVLNRPDYYILKDKTSRLDIGLRESLKLKNNKLIRFTKNNFTVAGETTRTLIYLTKNSVKNKKVSINNSN